MVRLLGETGPKAMAEESLAMGSSEEEKARKACSKICIRVFSVRCMLQASPGYYIHATP